MGKTRLAPCSRWGLLPLSAVACVLIPLAGAAQADDDLPPPVPSPPQVADTLPASVIHDIPPGVDPEAIRKLVDQYLKEAEEKKKEEEKKKKEEEEEKKKIQEAQFVEVATAPPLAGAWDNSVFFMSPNKDWRIHIGGRFEFNSVWWSQPQYLKGSPPGPHGIPGATATEGDGVGSLADGTYFRRVRLRADGTAYQNVEFIEEVDFEQLNLITFDHVWVGMKDVPFLGTVRVGQHKVPQGLESYGTDYYLTFLERSVLSEAFYTLFAPGVYVSNTYCDERVTTHAMFHRIQPLQYYTGAAFGDGDYAWTGRVTGLPYYANDGACLVHLGLSYQWRRGNLGRDIYPGGTGNAYADTQQVVRFRARPELRDAVGVLPPFIGGTSGRFVDTGFLLGQDVQTIGPEFMTTWGPLNVRAETAFAFVNNARSIYPASAFNTPRGNPTFWGGYIQASYFLTGEHWGYDRRFGLYDRPKTNENFFVVKGEDGCYHCGTGAWEVAYRFSYLDLNDNGINGGQLVQHTIGLNWYLNDNFRIQADYLNILRNVAKPALSGTVHGFGMQAQWYF